MHPQIITSAGWKALGVKFRTATNGQLVRKTLTKSLQTAVKPAVADVKRAVKAIDSKGVKGYGSRRRERSYKVRNEKGRFRSFGLRTTVARLVRSRVKYSGNTVGVRVFVDAHQMPNKQRRLPAHMDNPKGWRHPVWGNRERWAHQYGGPYFKKTLAAHTPRVRAAVVRDVDKALKELE